MKVEHANEWVCKAKKDWIAHIEQIDEKIIVKKPETNIV